MATKPELRRAVANSYIKASDYNYNFDQLNNYIENGVADNAINKYEADREYNKRDLVVAEIDGVLGIYRSKVDGNKGQSITNETYWKRENFVADFEEKLESALKTNQITNCLLEIPQRIKYTLEDGTLTIKVGSVVIVPYGISDKTSEFPIGATFLNNSFKVVDSQFTNGKFFVWAELQSDIVATANTSMGNGAYTIGIKPQSNSTTIRLADTQQGSGDDSNLGQNDLYYNTTTNAITTFLSGVNDNINSSFPILLINKADSGFTSINEVFNGIGYIGSTVWVDKGVKVLIPNGRNEDGTLSNIELTTRKVSTQTRRGNTGNNGVIFLDKNGNLYITPDNNPYYEQETQPNIATANWARWFNTKENLQYTKSANQDFIVASAQYAVVGKITSVNGVLSDLQIKQPFRAVDYNDYINTPHITETYVNGASWYRIWSDGWKEQGGTVTISQNGNVTVTFLKQFDNVNYVAFTQSTQTAANDGANNGTKVTIRNTTSMKLQNWEYGGTVMWYACGY